MKKIYLMIALIFLSACNDNKTNQNNVIPKSDKVDVKIHGQKWSQQINEIKIVDPFVDDKENSTQDNNGNVLLQVSIKNIEMVGYISDKQQGLALLKTPDNNIATVSKDMIIGIEHARIISITNNAILLAIEKNSRGIKEYRQEKIKM